MTGDAIRIDKWLWHARLVKTRSLAARLCETDLVMVRGAPCKKPAQPVHAGDQVQLNHGGWRRTVEIIALGTRRGPASEARELFCEIAAIPTADPDLTPLFAEGGDEDDELPGGE